MDAKAEAMVDAAEAMMAGGDAVAAYDSDFGILCPDCGLSDPWHGEELRPVPLRDMAADLDMERADDPDATLVDCYDCGATFAVRHGIIGWYHAV